MSWPALAARRRPVRARPVPDRGDPDNPSLELKEGRKQGASSPLFFQRPEIRLETRRLLGRRPEFLAVCRVIVFFRAEATSRPWLEPSATDSFIEPEPRNAHGMGSRRDEAPAEPVSVCAEQRGPAENSPWTDEKSVLDRVGVLHSAIVDGPSPTP